MRSVQELIDAGCGVCGEVLSDYMSEVFPAAMMLTLARDDGAVRWSRPKIVVLCAGCAADLEVEQQSAIGTGTYSSTDGNG